MTRLTQIGNVIPLITKSDLLSTEVIEDLRERIRSSAVNASFVTLPYDSNASVSESIGMLPAFAVSSAPGSDLDIMDASLLMSPDYVQPLVSSDLANLVNQIFSPDNISYLRHVAARKLITWQSSQLPPTSKSHSQPQSSPRTRSPAPTTTSPLLASTTMSNSGILVPVSTGIGSDLSLTTSNSYVLARLADHTQREERLAQIRLSKWAADLQLSLQRERERYERLARGDRAIWLVEKMGEEVEVKDGQLVPASTADADLATDSEKQGQRYEHWHSDGRGARVGYATHDPLGLLRLNDTMRSRGWIALQVIGSFGVVGGLALWLARSWGFTQTIGDYIAVDLSWLGYNTSE